MGLPKLNDNFGLFFKQNFISYKVSFKFLWHVNTIMLKQDYDRVVKIGQSILTLHQKKEWKEKTRSNYAQYKLESVYFAAEELEMVLISWKRMAENEYKEYKSIEFDANISEKEYTSCRKAKKNYNQIFKRSGIVTDCINALKNLRDVLKTYFLHPLIESFPRNVPFEVE